jgi:hypothetical protein
MHASSSGQLISAKKKKEEPETRLFSNIKNSIYSVLSAFPQHRQLTPAKIPTSLFL